jgi:hypothetical protein
MNEHDEIERLLGRYRPSGPPPSLRRRVAAGGGRSRARVSSGVRWLAAAAAVAMAATLHFQASRTFDRLAAPHIESTKVERATAIDDMTALLGGDILARHAAEQWFEASKAIAASSASVPATLETAWIR